MTLLLTYKSMMTILMKGPTTFEGSRRNLKKTGQEVSDEKLFKCVDGRMTGDGRRIITIAHPEPSAKVS